MANDPELDRTLTGIYSNFCRIGQSLFEFVIDFGQRYSEENDPVFHTRIVTTPVYFREFLAIMLAAAEQYRNDSSAGEQQHRSS